MLEKGRQEKKDFIFVAEAWEGKKGERTTQQGYRTFSKPGSQLVLYIRDGVDLTALNNIKVDDNRIMVGNLVTGIYISPRTPINSIREMLRDLPPTDILLGDFNCTHRHKR